MIIYQKNALLKRKGMAGTIITIIILSLLMLFSTSANKIIRTEVGIQQSVDYSKRAMDAAFSGIQFVMSVAQTRKEIFRNSQDYAKKRIYFAVDPTDITSLWPTGLNTNISNYPNLKKSFWMYLDQNIKYLYGHTQNTATDLNADSIIDADERDAVDTDEKEYQFRAVSYPIKDGSDIDLDKFLIKSQGKYVVFNDDETGAERTYKFQMIAEIKVNMTSPKKLILSKWRRMEYQETDALFGANTQY